MTTCTHAESEARARRVLRQEQAKAKSRRSQRLWDAAGAVLVTLEVERSACPTCSKQVT